MRFVLFLGLFVFFSSTILAQGSVNDYKYVIVPDKYEFLKENDAYQLNSLTKFLFNKYGFTALLQSEEKPQDLIDNGCKALRANVKDVSGFLKTKFRVELINCNAQTVFMSSEGTSKEKDFKKSYHEALRNAFKDVQELQYSYNQKAEENPDKPSEVILAALPKDVTQKEIIPKKSEVIESPEKTVAPKVPAKVDAGILLYSYNEANYTFKKQSYGYELLKNNVSLGKIYASSKDAVYIVKAGDLSGLGYFDAYGNFILDRINPATNKLITDTFARQ